MAILARWRGELGDDAFFGAAEATTVVFLRGLDPTTVYTESVESLVLRSVPAPRASFVMEFILNYWIDWDEPEHGAT